MFYENLTPLADALDKDLFPKLETFDCPFDSSGGTGVVRIIFPEFTCVCPKTGYPDFGTIGLYYLPDKLCVELKSWKLWLNSFRMIGTFHETVTAHIFETAKAVLSPRWIMVSGDFFPRGNVDTTVIFESDGQRPRGTDVLVTALKPYSRSFGQ